MDVLEIACNELAHGDVVLVLLCEGVEHDGTRLIEEECIVTCALKGVDERPEAATNICKQRCLIHGIAQFGDERGTRVCSGTNLDFDVIRNEFACYGVAHSASEFTDIHVCVSTGGSEVEEGVEKVELCNVDGFDILVGLGEAYCEIGGLCVQTSVPIP